MAEGTFFTITLEEAGEPGGELRVKNLGGTEVQRKHIIDRSDLMVVQADLTEVVHGNLSENGPRSTLVVIDFYVSPHYSSQDEVEFNLPRIHSFTRLPISFFPSSNSGRFKKATIDIAFGDETGDLDGGPAIARMAPHGKTAIRPTERHVEIKHGWTASAGASFTPANVSAGFAWERTTSQDERHQTTLVGMSRYDGREGGDKNAVRWILSENPAQEDGIPSHLRGLLLLAREDDKKFRAVVKVETKVDFMSSLKTMIGRKDKDDPVIFDPTPAKQPRELTWAKENSIDRSKLADVKLDDYVIILDAKLQADDRKT